MKIFVVQTAPSALNIRQLFGPLFFERDVRHPDMKRQSSRRLRDRELRAARALKLAYAPLCLVPHPVLYERRLTGRDEWARQEVRR